MNPHAVPFEQLADWVDGRLDPQTEHRVQSHLAAGCPACERDLAWLRRVTEAARTDQTAQPPAEAVAQVVALFRPHRRPLALLRRPIGRLRWRQLAVAVAAVLIVAFGVLSYLSQVPTLFARQALLAAVQGTAEARPAGDLEWRTLEEGARLGEGEQVRVAGGLAILTLFDGTLLEMQPGTELTLTSLRSGLLGATYRIQLTQLAGSVDYDVVPLRSPLSSFEAQAPTVRVSVHGTRFVITVETEVETKVTVLQGRVQVESAVESKELAEREVAIIPADAPLVLLPTLTPTATATPAVVRTERPSATAPSGREPARSAVAVTATPTQVVRPTETLQPSATPTTGSALVITPTARLTRTLRAPATPTRRATETPRVVRFSGLIERFPPPLLGTWRIGGRDVLVTRSTLIIGEPKLGQQAQVTASASVQQNAARERLVAIEIEIEEAEPAHTAEATHTAEPSPTPRPTHTTRPTRTPRAARSPGPPSRPEPTPTASSQPSPDTDNTAFTGTIESLPPGRMGVWIISGRTVIVGASTSVEGVAAVGLEAEVEAVQRSDASLHAIKIRVRG